MSARGGCGPHPRPADAVRGGGARKAHPLVAAVEVGEPWTPLFSAGLFEVGGAVGLKYSRGFSRPWATVWTVVALAASTLLLAKAVEDLPVGTAYAVWTGIGAVGTAALGVLLLDEPATLRRAAFVGLVVAGTVGLQVTAN